MQRSLTCTGISLEAQSPFGMVLEYAHISRKANKLL